MADSPGPDRQTDAATEAAILGIGSVCEVMAETQRLPVAVKDLRLLLAEISRLRAAALAGTPTPDDKARLLVDFLNDTVDGRDVIFRRTRSPDSYCDDDLEGAEEIEVRRWHGPNEDSSEDDVWTAEEALEHYAEGQGTPEFVAKLQAAQAGTAPASDEMQADETQVESVARFAYAEYCRGRYDDRWDDLLFITREFFRHGARKALAVGAPATDQQKVAADMRACSGGAPAAPAPDRERMPTNVNHNQLTQQASQICGEIENLPASEQQTRCAIAASALLRAIYLQTEAGAASARAPAPEPADDEEARLAVEEAIETGSGNGQRLRHITDAEREALDTYYCAAYETGWVNALAHGVPGGAPPAAPTPNEMSTNGELVGGAARPAEPPPRKAFRSLDEFTEHYLPDLWAREELDRLLRAAPPPSEAPTKEQANDNP